MDDKKIEEIIDNEFEKDLKIIDEEIKNMSFAESCVYLDSLNKIMQRIEELRGKTTEEGAK